MCSILDTESKVTKCNRMSLPSFKQKSMSQDEINQSQTTIFNNVYACPPHTPWRTTNFLQEQDIEVIPWCACSPDPNPIDNLWDELGRQVRSREQYPVNRQTLIQALQEEWTELCQDYARQLVQSMHQRCLECVQARGGHTHYCTLLFVTD